MTIAPVSYPSTTTEPPATRSQEGESLPSDGQLRAGTYNLAAANPEHNGSDQIESTTRTLAQQVVGGVDVVALQEVDVGTNGAAAGLRRPLDFLLHSGMDDYNEYVLAQISAEEQGLQGEVAYLRQIDERNGSPVTIITGVDAEGRTSQVVISREYYTQDGTRLAGPLPNVFGVVTSPVTVYNAEVQSPGGLRNYTVVYGASRERDDGTFGNALLLGPRAELQRDADGNALVARRDLDANDPTDNENRTALEARIDVDGESATIFSAHLTYDDGGEEYEDASEAKKAEIAEQAAEAREQQYKALAQLAAASGDNTLLLGDFNDTGRPSIGPLTGENHDENRVDPLTRALSEAVNGGSENLDRIYVSDDVTVGGREERVFDGGSDHEMVIWDIDLGR